MKKLESQEAGTLLQDLPHWTLDAAGGAISREYVLADFVQAFGFMTQIAITAEKHNHHPEWRNVYRRVHITWTTHDAGGLTLNDIALAQWCDTAFAGYAAQAVPLPASVPLPLPATQA